MVTFPSGVCVPVSPLMVRKEFWGMVTFGVNDTCTNRVRVRERARVGVED
jgi:hypothetical protein